MGADSSGSFPFIAIVSLGRILSMGQAIIGFSLAIVSAVRTFIVSTLCAEAQKAIAVIATHSIISFLIASWCDFGDVAAEVDFGGADAVEGHGGIHVVEAVVLLEFALDVALEDSTADAVNKDYLLDAI